MLTVRGVTSPTRLGQGVFKGGFALLCRGRCRRRRRRIWSCENFAATKILNTVSLQSEERASRSHPPPAVPLAHQSHDERHNYRYVYATIAIFCCCSRLVLRAEQSEMAAAWCYLALPQNGFALSPRERSYDLIAREGYRGRERERAMRSERARKRRSGRGRGAERSAAAKELKKYRRV